MLKIFLVDDSNDTRRMLVQYFEFAGYEVASADTMESALRDFPAFGADILLTDIGLPDGDGWQLLRRLHANGHAPYAIAMSGFGASTDLEASKQAGFHHHLVKPVSLGMLERTLAQACEDLQRAG